MRLEFVHVPECRSVAIDVEWIQVRYGEIVAGDDVIANERQGLWEFRGDLYTDFICSDQGGW